MEWSSLLNLLLLIFGFGFVIFFHELGHFLAAKWAGVKVDQFAVGFGQALLCWRRGLGVRIGTTRPEYERRARELMQSRPQPISFASESEEMRRIDEAAAELGLGETEYRLNWIPLGGYVKMVGQDDLNPHATSPDPRAYNNKPISQRMVIVSAGVIMNILLAGILFCILFLHGFKAPAPVIGMVQPWSPAQRAGLRVGDEVQSLNGHAMHDFTKIRIWAALASPSEGAEIIVRRDGRDVPPISVQARKDETDPAGFMQLGVGGAPLLRAIDEELPFDPKLHPASYGILRPGDVIVAVNGRAVSRSDAPESLTHDLLVLDEELQKAAGAPITLSIRGGDGATRSAQVRGELMTPFGRDGLHFAGMQPAVQIEGIEAESPVVGKLQPGDIVTRIEAGIPSRDAVDFPTTRKFREIVDLAATAGGTVNVHVLRDGNPLVIENLEPTMRLRNQKGKRGLGVLQANALSVAIVSATLPDSPAAAAGIPAGATITAVDGVAVHSWFEVQSLLAKSTGERPVALSFRDAGGAERTATLSLGREQAEMLASLRYVLDLPLAQRQVIRRTTNPLVALAWGAGETRDLIIQFYITLRRIIYDQTISASNLSGPVGILHQGTLIASRGTDWMIWYLAVISANLAVVNFLPLPIVDGGLFVFLLIEKLRGKPVSPRVQAITQIVGLALIVSLFLFVTYNDILRLM